MADTEVRLPCDSGTGDDDSPPVCLVQLNSSRIPPETTKGNLNSSKRSLETNTCGNITCFSPSATENSPEFSQFGNSTPEKTLTKDESYSPIPGVSITGASCTSNSSADFQTSANESADLSNMRQECQGASNASLAPSPSDSSDRDSTTTAAPLDTAPRPSDSDQSGVDKSQSNPPEQTHLVPSVSNFEDIQPMDDGLEKDNKKKVDLAEDEDEFDLEERPLTVDVPQEPEGSTNLSTDSTKTFPTFMEHDSINSVVEVDANHHNSVPTNVHQRISVTAATAVSRCTDQPIKNTHIESLCRPDTPSPMTSLKTSPTIQDNCDVTTSESRSANEEAGTKETGVDKSCPVAAAASLSSEANTLSSSVVTSAHSLVGISSCLSSAPITRNQSSLTELDTVKSENPLTETSSSTGSMIVTSSSHLSETTGTIIPTLTSDSSLTPPVPLVCQSTVQLMPFVATSIPGPPTSMLGSLTASHTGPGTSSLSSTGDTQPGASNGPGSLQIFNMAPMPQFVAGTPGIVLHATGTVAGAPGYPSSTPLLPGLPTVGNASGLGGSATLNFLQPHQSFTTTLLPQSAHGSEYLFDLGLSQTPFPPNSSSITIFNPVESMGAAAAVPHALYPTIIQPPTPGPQPHSQSLFSASCGPNTPISAPLFVSPPSYRPTIGGVTNLVSSTTPQMATSLGSGSGPFVSPNLPSLGASATPSGFLFQTTNPHQHQPTPQLSSSCGPLLQSCQFPPYQMPFQGTDPCLPLASSALSGYRTVEQSIETTVSSVANIHTNTGLPQLWASSTAPVSFSPIPVCLNTLSQSTNFPISVNSTTVASTATVTTSLTAASTVLPHPPALQPCPALTKRFQPLCPLPVGRGSVGPTTGGFLSSPTRRSSGLTVRPQLSSTGIASSSVQNSEKRKVISTGITTVIRSRPPLRSGTGAKPELAGSPACTLATVPNTFCSTMTIRTPNSVTVIPAIRRRRPLAKVTSSMKTVNKPDIQSIDGPLTSSSTVATDHPLQTTGHPNTTVSEPKATSVVTMSVSSSSGECTVSSPSVRCTGPQTLGSSPVGETHSQLPTTTGTVSVAHTLISVEPFVTCLDDYESPAHTSTTNAPGSTANLNAISVSNSVITAPTESQTIDATDKIESCDNDLPPLERNHILRHSGSPISTMRVAEPTQSSSSSPNREFSLTNGIQQRDSTELQTSLERLGVSGNHKTKEPRSATLTDTTSPQKSSRETADLLHDPVKSGHTIGSTFHSPPPLLHHGPDDRRVLTHYIDGHVIYESNKPFPVKHGMAVVEAALLHQCIEEEKLECLTADALDTSQCLPRQNRTSSKPLIVPQSPTSSSLNGAQPMQLDAPLPVSISEKNKSSDQDMDARGPNHQTFARHLEDRSPMHSSSSGLFVCQNGGSASSVAAGAFESIMNHATTDNTHPEFLNHLTDSAVSTEDSASYTQSLDAVHLNSSTTPTRVPSPVQKDRTQHLLPAVHALLDGNSGIRSDRKPNETDSNYQPILPKIPVVSRKSSPARNPTPHEPQTTVSATQPFSSLFVHSHSHPAPQIPEPPPPGPVRYWSADDVMAFVRGTPGCGAYAEAFHTNEIDGEALLLLAEDQFIQPPIGMKLGPALKLAARLETLRNLT